MTISSCHVGLTCLSDAVPRRCPSWIARACIAAITSYDWVVASRSALVRAAPFVALVGVVGVFLFLSFVKVEERERSLTTHQRSTFLPWHQLHWDAASDTKQGARGSRSVAVLGD